MARQNYSFEKRKKELARKQKKDEKLLRRLTKSEEPGDGDAGCDEQPPETPAAP